MQSYESTGAGHSSAPASLKPMRADRHSWFPPHREGGGRLFFVHAAQQFFAHDNVEPRLLIGIEHSAHFEDVRDSVSLGLAHGVVKPINRLAEALTLGVILGHCGSDVARGCAQLSVKGALAQGVTVFDRFQTLVLFRRQIKFAMDRCIERVPMGVGTREHCPDKDAPQPRPEPDECCERQQLPSFQHDLSAERSGRRIGLIERKRSNIDRNRRGGRRHADGRADQKHKAADAGHGAVGAGARAALCARINPGPDIAFQPLQCCVDVHPAQSGELAIKVGQGSLRAITFFYTRAAARALGRASPSGSARARTRRPRRKCRDLIQSKARMQVRRDLVMGPRSSRPARRS